MSFGMRVRIMRLVREFTQEYLASYIGTSRTQISLMESNGWTPDARRENDIREALHWGPAEDAALDVLEGKS